MVVSYINRINITIFYYFSTNKTYLCGIYCKYELSVVEDRNYCYLCISNNKEK